VTGAVIGSLAGEHGLITPSPDAAVWPVAVSPMPASMAAGSSGAAIGSLAGVTGLAIGSLAGVHGLITPSPDAAASPMPASMAAGSGKRGWP